MSVQVTIFRPATLDAGPYVITRSIRIRESIGQPLTCDLTLKDQGALDIGIGNVIIVSFEGAVIFTGRIDKIRQSYPARGARFLECNCTDPTYVASRYTVTAVYQDQLAGDIVKDIFTSASDIKNESFGVASVNDGFVVDEVRFDQWKVSRAMDRLSQLMGYSWWIDFDGNVQFFPRNFNPAPVNLDKDTRKYSTVTHTIDRDGYYNRLILRAGNQTISDQRSGLFESETFKGDAATRSYNVKYPLAAAAAQPSSGHPTIDVDGSDRTAAGKVAIRGEDEDLPSTAAPTYEWFWAPEETQITRNRNLSPLTASNTLTVTYNGLIPIIVQAENLSQISERATEELSQGIYEEVIDDESIDGLQNAIERAESLLSNNDQLREVLTFDTPVNEFFKAGQEMAVDLPELGVSGSWVVNRVNITFPTRLRRRTRIDLTNSFPSETDEHAFWRKLESQGRKFVINENQQVVVLKKATDALSTDDSTTFVNTGNTLAAAANDHHTKGRMGEAFMAGLRIGEMPV